MDFNATQAVNFSHIEDDNHENCTETDDNDPVAVLTLQPYQREACSKSFHVYKGINVVGREVSKGCQILIPFPVISHRHAIIEVDSDTHMIYDLGSLNKTKKGKLTLKPQVHYEILDGDVLTFGDVICHYSINCQTKKSTLLTPSKFVKSNNNTNDDSSANCKLGLHNTSNLEKLKVSKKSSGYDHCSNILTDGFVLRSDSDFSSDEEIPPSCPNGTKVCIPETPEDTRTDLQNGVARTSSRVSGIDDYKLDSDTDIDEDASTIEAPTQVYMMDDNVSSIEEPILINDEVENIQKIQNLSGEDPKSKDLEKHVLNDIILESSKERNRKSRSKSGNLKSAKKLKTSKEKKTDQNDTEKSLYSSSDWANLPTQQYIIKDVEIEVEPVQLTADKSKVETSGKKSSKKSKSGSISVEPGSELDYVSPATDDDMKSLKQKVKAIINSETLSSQKQPTGKSKESVTTRQSRRNSVSSIINNGESPRRASSRIKHQAINTKNKSTAIPKIMFTGLSEKSELDMRKIVQNLEGKLVDSVFDCTHLVTDKIRRTCKFLCLLSRGCYIVSPKWLLQCSSKKTFLDADPYHVTDAKTEKHYEFSLSKSLESARKVPFLKDFQLYVTPNVKPPPEEMRTIIECSGGKFLSRMPMSGERKVIVSCPEDVALCKKAKQKIPVVTSEFILTGVLRQAVAVESYRL